MLIAVNELFGVGSIPGSKPAALAWLKRNEVSFETHGQRYLFQVSDLPEPERLAFLRLEFERLELSEGTFDDAAHEAFAAAKPEARVRAERKAAIARLWVSLREQGVKEGDRIALVRQRFGSKGTSKPSLMRIQKQVEGVDPINFAPALLDNYKATSSRADLSDEAWRFFMTMIRDAAPTWPLKAAWRRVRDAGQPLGWSVPSFPTFYRRWQELDEAQRVEARLGLNEASKRFVQPAHRDKTTLFPMQYVSLDGRTQDFWVRWANGSVSRPVMLMLVDVASNFILGWELVETENATATVRLIKSVCQRFGIFDCLYTDNGSAFAGHLVAGGNGFRFRNGAPKGLQPTGICEIMGIKLQFALPKNAQAKIAERIFATLSRVVDDGPEFKGAHSGHAPGASPSDKTTPVPIEAAKAALRRGVESHNREAGRQSQGARGRSYEAMFRDGLERREKPLRTPTARQLYLSGLIWKPVAVDRFGQCQVDGWIYGDICTQDTLLRHHGKGQRILLGRDPNDLQAPALAYDEDGHLICEDIQPVKRGDYDSADGIRTAARNRKVARRKVQEAEAANNYLEDADYARFMAALDAAAEANETLPPAPKKVVGVGPLAGLCPDVAGDGFLGFGVSRAGGQKGALPTLGGVGLIVAVAVSRRRGIGDQLSIRAAIGIQLSIVLEGAFGQHAFGF